MLHSRFRKAVVILVLSIFVLQLLGYGAPASAAWVQRDLPEEDDSTTTTLMIVGVAVAVGVVVYFVLKNRGGDDDESESSLRVSPGEDLAFGGAGRTVLDRGADGLPKLPTINLILDVRSTRPNSYGDTIYAGMMLSF